MIPGVVSDIGGFGGLFAPNLTGMSEPVLVSGTDGVGTKQRIAQLMNKHDSVGIDCVAMCVNDIICCGAKPIFFLDYIAIGKNEPEKVATLVSGVAEGCDADKAYFISTYQGDGTPLPTFAGEPMEVSVPSPEEVWDALNEDNKVSLYANVNGEVKLFNKNLGD